MREYDFAVVIMRGEPPHKAHLKIVRSALVVARRCIVIFGSHRGAPSIKNPWTFQQRRDMLADCLKEDPEEWERVSVIAVRDHPYADNYWLAEVHAKVRTLTELYHERSAAPKIALVGYKKDASSFYLDLFKQWTFVDTGTLEKGISATNIRKSYFLEDIVDEFRPSADEDEDEDEAEEGKTSRARRQKTYDDLRAHLEKCKWREHVPMPVVRYLEDFKRTEMFENLQKDYKYVVNYKAKWEGTPFPVTFTTVDAVVVKSGHVLVVRRKRNPGKDLIALPGGFINPNEWICDAAVRELYEETTIDMHPDELKKHLKGSHVFDHPNRSARGRVITHAYHFELPNKGELPRVKGMDDAKEAFWMPLGDLGFLEEQIFEDHLHIIHYFTMRHGA